MTTPLADLDELVLKCRNTKSRNYLSEALASYRAGAFRATIVTTWIAVCFDIIDKFRELALTGDKEAEAQVAELETITQSHDLSSALKFEKNILDLARDKFELVSPLEYLDLQRLLEDRHRCAHPSLISNEEVFSPPAELARLHIRSAVTHLLQHPAVQGKAALDRLKSEVFSEYFPQLRAKAKVALETGPLSKPRNSLVRNFVVVLLKALLNEDHTPKRNDALGAAIAAVAEMHPTAYGSAMADSLSRILRRLPDTSLKKGILFLRRIEDSWQYVEEALRQKLTAFVEALPVQDLDVLNFLLSYPPFQETAIRRLNATSFNEVKYLCDQPILDDFADPHPLVLDRLVDLYLRSSSFESANEQAKFMSTMVPWLKANHVRRVVEGAAANDQVRGSFRLSALLREMRGRKSMSQQDFDDLIQANGLGDKVPPAEG